MQGGYSGQCSRHGHAGKPGRGHTGRLTAGVYSEDPAEVEKFLTEIHAGVLYVNRRAGATTGAWPGVQAFGGWKGSGSTGKAGLSMYYVAQFLREQSHTVVD